MCQTPGLTQWFSALTPLWSSLGSTWPVIIWVKWGTAEQTPALVCLNFHRSNPGDFDVQTGHH